MNGTKIRIEILNTFCHFDNEFILFFHKHHTRQLLIKISWM